MVLTDGRSQDDVVDAALEAKVRGLPTDVATSAAVSIRRSVRGVCNGLQE